MAKKSYSAPVVVTENIEIGVFGSYGSGSSGGGFKLSKKANGRRRGVWGWPLWPWNW